jgi:GTP pyrophosphokinase/guanosine-3',5'-bis(diphosphate) 3'-pyrophosphohydrolase
MTDKPTIPTTEMPDFAQQLRRAETAFFSAAGVYLSADDLAYLRRALLVSHAAHYGQTRKSGEPYISHPIAVATILTEWHLDVQGLAAALLHDVLEDTGTSKSMIAKAFGAAVADLVDGLSKLEKLDYQTQEAAQAENFRKMVLAMGRDIRVIIIKLADRLHNMRTMESMREDKRHRIARETLEIYAPIANRLGLDKIFRELQELGFLYLHPKRHQVLTKAVKATRGNRREVVEKMLLAIRATLAQANLTAEVSGREKNLYGIHQKMQDKHLSFAEVLDIYAFRVIVEETSDCYVALGLLHGLYKPIPGKFKDYIAIPKNNGYQSLHTILFSPFGAPLEIQIRSRKMHNIAESGIAAHWLYKDAVSDTEALGVQQNTHQWLQSILDLQAENMDSVEFFEHIKVDLFPDEVYVFTPKGKIMVLPKYATTVDFAYAVHTDVGHCTVAAKVNFLSVPLWTVLHNGDTVEMVTGTQKMPNPDWLSFVISARARSGIRNYLKTLEREEAISLGRRLFKKACDALMPENFALSETHKIAYLQTQSDKYQAFDDVLADVGMGKLLPLSLARQLLNVAGKNLDEPLLLAPLVIRGNEGSNVALSPCCNPIKGDEVAGVLIKEQGVVVHRMDCKNLVHADAEKVLALQWDSENCDPFSVSLQIDAVQERGVIAGIAVTVANENAHIEKVETYALSPDIGRITMRIQVLDVDQLGKILHNIQLLPTVNRASRL